MKQTVSNRKIQQARQMWRLCAAAEVILAQRGAKATVAQILKLAGMSRRSFYEFFTSIEHIEDQMVYHRTLSHIGPCANWMAWVRNPTFLGPLGGDANAAFAASREAAKREPLPVPAMDELLAWFDKRQLVSIADNVVHEDGSTPGIAVVTEQEAAQ